MPRQDGRIEPGQKLTTAISARAWNRAQQAADIVLGAVPGLTAGPASYGSSPYTWVYAKNATGSTVNRWGVIAIIGVEVTPTSDAAAGATRQFESMPVMTCDSITSSPTQERCVAIEPIANGKIGRVAVAGTVQVKASDANSVTGSAVLWKDDNWALVRFGGGGGIRLGTISATWNKGSEATVTQIKGNGDAISPTVEFTAKNWFAKVTVTTGTKKVACAKVDSTWILIAAEC